jgi:cytochrome c oxidase subunit 2
VFTRRPQFAPARLAPLAAAVLLAGCTGSPTTQSPLDPAGPQTGDFLGLFKLFVGVAIGVFGMVTLSLIPALRRRLTGTIPAPHEQPQPAREKRAMVVTGALVGVTTLTLIVLLVGDFLTGQRSHALYDAQETPVRISIVGHQWWWEVVYENEAEPYKTFATANELHLPSGRLIEFDLNSVDVIHSFWVPNLHGKKDMIPGHPTTLRLRTDRVGNFTGQCAEFCGHQHAKMRLNVTVETPEQFEHWLARQLQPAPQPTTDSQRRGQQVFLSSSCVMCHRIDGTLARGSVGPSLTHLASRPTIGAAAVPNNRGNLGGWVLDPHTVKPGVRMPQNSLAPADLQSLLDYLESLK